MTRLSKVFALLGLTLIVGHWLNTPSFAESYPSKTLTLIVPYSPGGRTDLTARIVSGRLEKYLGVPVVIENKPGASSVRGSKEVAKSKPDGYTLGFFSNGFSASQYTVTTPNDVKEFELVALINTDPAAIAVVGNATWRSLKELVEYAKKNPGQVKSGINTGAATHVFEAAFAKAAGIKFTSVPYRSGAERIPALLGGHVDVNFEIVAPLRSLVEAGRVRILAIAADERNPMYPDFPTAKEQGVNWVMSSWHGIFAPKGTPMDLIAVLENALEKSAQDQELIALMKKSLLQVKYLDRIQFIKFFKQQDSIFEEIIRDLGLYKRPE